MRFLDLFSEVEKEGVRLSVEGGKVELSASLPRERHEYIYATTNVSLDHLAASSVSLMLLSGPGLSVAGVVLFYDKGCERIGGKVFSTNQLESMEIPAGAVSAKVGLRVQGSGVSHILDFYLGEPSLVNRSINQRGGLDFGNFLPERTLTYDTDTPLVFIETVFCDVEKSQAVLDRYMSFFYGTIKSIARQTYRNFIWIINVSADKRGVIERIKMAITLAGLEGRAVVNIYEHPNEGYGNEGDTHIDRLLKPNVALPHRREFLFKKAINEGGGIDLDHHSGQVLIRLGIDDDDFFFPTHIQSLVEFVQTKLGGGEDFSGQAIFASRRLCVSYFFPEGSVEVYDVTFDRFVTGCKCSVAVGAFPCSPFSISEKIEAVSKSSYQFFEVESSKPTFSYNRHGVNLSSQSKQHFYKGVYGRKCFSSVPEVLSYFGFSDSAPRLEDGKI